MCVCGCGVVSFLIFVILLLLLFTIYLLKLLISLLAKETEGRQEKSGQGRERRKLAFGGGVDCYYCCCHCIASLFSTFLLACSIFLAFFPTLPFSPLYVITAFGFGKLNFSIKRLLLIDSNCNPNYVRCTSWLISLSTIAIAPLALSMCDVCIYTFIHAYVYDALSINHTPRCTHINTHSCSTARALFLLFSRAEFTTDIAHGFSKSLSTITRITKGLRTKRKSKDNWQDGTGRKDK